MMLQNPPDISIHSFDIGQFMCFFCLTFKPGCACDTEGIITPIECPEGTSINPITYKCDPCLKGFYTTQKSKTNLESLFFFLKCFNSNNKKGSIVCNICPPGRKCPKPDESPKICEKGESSPAGSTSCFKCPCGTYAGEMKH